MTPEAAFEQKNPNKTKKRNTKTTQHTSFPSKTQPWTYKSQRIYCVCKWHKL